ncbi:hypothetical protein GII40_00292 [Candidatus Profftia lariciata]|nr:hypothetical protein GII40_00292 [Candidatus Profftia lariciata]
MSISKTLESDLIHNNSVILALHKAMTLSVLNLLVTQYYHKLYKV